jgi:hypothetical protein
MFDFVFETRNKNITALIKLGDLLGRSLRENTVLFTVDTENKTVSYITEGNKIISGTYLLDKDKIHLSNVTVEESSIFDNPDNINPIIESRITSFIDSIAKDDYSSANSSFQDVLDSWELKYKFDRRQKDFNSRIKQFNESQNILKSPTFHKVIEVTPKLTDFLKENKDKIGKVVEITNGIKLSNIISKAFDLKKVTLDILEKTGLSFNLVEDSKPIYEMICRQELLKKELLESKRDFASIWATNDKLISLAGNVLSKDSEVEKSLAEAIAEVPYAALASKKDLYNVINNSLELNENISVTPKDIKNYISKLFEMKKPVKQRLIDLLSERYGINVANLKDPPSFGSLINTQVVVFEALAKISPKNSVQKQVLMEFAKELKNKSGIESLDLNDYIQNLFTTAGFKTYINENAMLLQFLDFEKVGQQLAGVAGILQMLKKINPGAGGLGGGGQNPADLTGYQGEDSAGAPSNVPGAANMDSEGGESSSPTMDANNVPNPADAGVGTAPNPGAGAQAAGQPTTDLSTPMGNTSLDGNMAPTKIDLAQLNLQMKEIKDLLTALGVGGEDMGEGDEFDNGFNPMETQGEEGMEMGGEPGMEGEGGEGQPFGGEESPEEEAAEGEEVEGDEKPEFGGKSKGGEEKGKKAPPKKEGGEKKPAKKKESKEKK